MGKQRVGLVGKVGESIINLHVLNLKPRAGARLVNPYLFLVKGISIGQGFLKIVDPRPDEKYIVDIAFKPKFGVSTYRIGTEHGVALPVKSQVNIRFRQQRRFFSQAKLTGHTDHQPGSR